MFLSHVLELYHNYMIILEPISRTFIVWSGLRSCKRNLYHLNDHTSHVSM